MDLVPFFTLFILVIAGIFYKIKNPDESIDRISDVIGTEDLCDGGSDENNNTREIFFLETSGEECLAVRQACSVESVSLTNPDANIVVRMEGTGIIPGEFYAKWKSGRQGLPGYDRSCTITNTISKLKNVNLIKEDLLAHLKDTPLETLLKDKGGILDSEFPLAQRSDLVRAAILWKYGGLYLDHDIIVYRPLYCLKNTIGLKDWIHKGDPVLNWVENGVITFEASHPFTKYLMHYLVEEYRPDYYFSLGPSTVASALLDFCEKDELPNPKTGGILKCWNDSEIIFQPTSAFYALDNKQKENIFFKNHFELEDVEILKKSYLSHIYGSENGIKTLPESLYGRLAQSYCPITYQMALKEFGQF